MSDICLSCMQVSPLSQAVEDAAWKELLSRFPQSESFFVPLCRIRNAQRRAESLGAYTLLTHVLPTGGKRLLRGKDGKPQLEDGSAIFSLSHAGGYAFCALATDGIDSLGVDAEPCNRLSTERALRLAHSRFSPAEREEVDGAVSFLRLWTRKEAYAKYIGTGLRTDLQKIPTTNQNGVCFAEYRFEEMLISLAYPAGALPPAEIKTVKGIYDRLNRLT